MEEMMGRLSLQKMMNLVLLGKIGAGKSASGNTILGRDAFQSKKSFSSITQDVAVASGIVCGRRVTVYDTPGLFNTKLSEEEIQQMINVNVLQRCESVLCVFLLVIKADRFTGKERETVEKIEELLGEERLKKTWILFTRGDELEKENKSIDEFVYETKALMRLVQKYDQRYCVFNNKKRRPNGQVQELLTKIYATYPDRIKKEAKPKQERRVKTRRIPNSFPVSWLSSLHQFSPVEESFSMSADEITAQKSIRHGPGFVSVGPDQIFYDSEPEKEAKPKQERRVKARHYRPSSYLWNPMEESSSMSEDEVTALEPEELDFRCFREIIPEKEAKPKQERRVKTKGQLKCFPVAQTVEPRSLHRQGHGFDSQGKQGLMRMPSSYLWNPMEESSSMSEDEVTALEPEVLDFRCFREIIPDSPESCEIPPECFFTSSNACDYASRRIVLLGQTGVGKSAAGNTILGQREFKSIRSTKSVTTECLEKHGTVSGRSVSVVDTPGLYHTELKTQELMTEIARSVYIYSRGPHAFIIVFRVDVRFTDQELQIPQMIEVMFEEVLKYSIILFTHGDLLEGKPIERLIQENSRLRDLVGQCGGRFHVFNNRDVNNRDQVTDLLKKIDTMIEQNGGGHYSHQMIQDPLRLRREERERKQQEKQRQEEIERVRKGTEERIKVKRSNKISTSKTQFKQTERGRGEELEELDFW